MVILDVLLVVVVVEVVVEVVVAVLAASVLVVVESSNISVSRISRNINRQLKIHY